MSDTTPRTSRFVMSDDRLGRLPARNGVPDGLLRVCGPRDESRNTSSTCGVDRGPPGIRTPNLRMKSLVRRCRSAGRNGSELGVCVSLLLVVSHRFPFLHGDETGTRPILALSFPRHDRVRVTRVCVSFMVAVPFSWFGRSVGPTCLPDRLRRIQLQRDLAHQEVEVAFLSHLNSPSPSVGDDRYDDEPSVLLRLVDAGSGAYVTCFMPWPFRTPGARRGGRPGSPLRWG